MINYNEECLNREFQELLKSVQEAKKAYDSSFDMRESSHFYEILCLRYEKFGYFLSDRAEELSFMLSIVEGSEDGSTESV